MSLASIRATLDGAKQRWIHTGPNCGCPQCEQSRHAATHLAALLKLAEAVRDMDVSHGTACKVWALHTPDSMDGWEEWSDACTCGLSRACDILDEIEEMP